MAVIDTEGSSINLGNGYPVMPYGFGGYGNNGGFFNGDGIWAIILFAMIFGNGNWGFGGGNFGGGAGNMLYDINANTNRGFDQASIISGLNSIQGTLSDAQVARCNNTTTLLQAMNSNQNVTNSTLADLGMAFQQCCCDNRLASADLRYTVATENAADREALSNGIRDIIASNTANTQAILDKLCQQEIDAKNDLISQLRSQLSMADLKASQTEQTAILRAGQNAEVDALYNRLSNCPVPSTPVYGRVPIFTCNGNGCGCSAIQ